MFSEKVQVENIHCRESLARSSALEMRDKQHIGSFIHSITPLH